MQKLLLAVASKIGSCCDHLQERSVWSITASWCTAAVDRLHIPSFSLRSLSLCPAHVVCSIVCDHKMMGPMLPNIVFLCVRMSVRERPAISLHLWDFHFKLCKTAYFGNDIAKKKTQNALFYILCCVVNHTVSDKSYSCQSRTTDDLITAVALIFSVPVSSVWGSYTL